MVSVHVISHPADSQDHGHHHAKHSHETKKTAQQHHNNKGKSHKNELKLTKASSTQKSPFKVMHQHENDSSDNSGEPHEHTFTFSAPFISFLNPSYELDLPNIEDMNTSAIPIDLFVEEPYLKGLFRPPIS